MHCNDENPVWFPLFFEILIYAKQFGIFTISVMNLGHFARSIKIQIQFLTGTAAFC